MKALIFVALFLIFSSAAFGGNPPAGEKVDFLIDADKAYVYLLFDHVGKGVRYFSDEPDTRIWFHLMNNCRMPIQVHTFSMPDGSLKGEIGVMHFLVAEQLRGVVVTSEAVPLEGTAEASGAVAEKKLPLPQDYWFEVGSWETIRPGESILFSIPTNHLSEKWHIEIPYKFELPTKCCRPENVGGETKMVLLYGKWHLPPEVAKQLKMLP
jgi:hypothetical protein